MEIHVQDYTDQMLAIINTDNVCRDWFERIYLILITEMGTCMCLTWLKPLDLQGPPLSFFCELIGAYL